ncbi:AAA family ATPase [Falsiroseomonas sp. HW251]|uniref:bifunctional aminoglycoside phosphotransferase/ATP-binding protein n=1 Tax=Falsiroseomonas sp. HW251 TaxID=3390998 RepID=UPI003D315A71
MIPSGQGEVAALLSRLTAATPIETHISAVFVGPDDAFKLKKAVTLPFVDQGSLARREAFCRRELELNRPNAPGIYRDVVPVTRGPAGLRLGGEGEAVEWVLRMAPVPEADFLDAVAARGGLDGRMLDGLADAVAALLAAAPVAEGVNAVARMETVLEGNLQGCLAVGLDRARVDAVAASMRARLAALAPLLRERAAAGFVRRCHGDLHLGNLCLWEGRPVAFDALEFDEALARVDVGYELAFLLMDLDVKLDRAAANRVMNRVLARNADVAMLPALPFWMAQRALVRAKLEPARGRPGLPYLDAAERYLAPAAPRLVAIGGVQGTGKTFAARAVAPLLGAAPGALHLRSDEIRKRLAGVAPEDRLPQAAYSAEASAAVHAAMMDAARAALAAGHSVVLDATFLDPAVRAMAQAAAGTARFDGVFLSAPVEVLRDRVAGRRDDASDATVEVMERAAAADPGPLGSWTRLDASGDPRARLLDLLALTSATRA